MNIKLVFIGEDSNVQSFTYKGKTYCPYYKFGEAYKESDLTSFLGKEVAINYNDFIAESKKVGNPLANIYSCVSGETEEYFMPVSGSIMREFKVPNKEIVQEKVQPKRISGIYGIITSSQPIIDMMKKRGCKVLKDNDSYLIIEEEKLKYQKKYRDDIKINTSSVKKAKTKTGYEELVNISGTCGKDRFNVQGEAVFSIRQNHYYLHFKYAGEDFYMEKWFDAKKQGGLIKAQKNSDFQSERIYSWRV